MTALARLDAIDQARQRVLHEGGLLDAPLVEGWIEQSWRRCLSFGHRPQDAVEFDAVSTARMRGVREASEPLLAAASTELDRISRAISGTRYFVLLTDAQGIVIDTRGEIDRQDRHASAIARVGVDLSEQRVGTTAIGAALRELRPVWLHRGEHFFRSTGVYSCAGAPLFDPQGRCVGMLDLTGVNTQERPELRLLAEQAARGIENALLLRQPASLRLHLNWPGRPMAGDGDGLLHLDADGQILGANLQARQMAGLPPALGHAGDVFALPWQTLFDLARTGQHSAEVPLWSGLRVQVQALLPELAKGATAQAAAEPAPGALKDIESALIRRVMQQARGNVAEAARRLGISRATLYRRIGRQPPGHGS